MINGTVKVFNAFKGFGFISPFDGSKDAFVPIFAVERAVLETEEQRFEGDQIVALCADDAYPLARA